MKNEKIIVAHIIGKWLGGGVESVVMNYYRNMDRDKIQFHFLCDEDSTDIPYDEIEKLGGKVILIPPYQKLIRYNKELTRVFKENNYKIVHSHINTLSVFPLRIAKKCGVPVRIAHSHSTTNKKEWKKNIIKQILRPFSKKYANRYMCCSELAGRWLFGDKAYDEGKVYLLNNAIDTEKFKFNEEVRRKKRKELGIDDDTFVVGHIGRFVEQKNHSFLVDVFNEIYKLNKNSILLLVGQGPLMDKIKKKVCELKLENCVKFLGQRSDVSELYQVMDTFLFPSLYEGLGMVLIEAQYTGINCIVSSEVPEVAKISENCYFMDLKQNPSFWANKILNFEKENYDVDISNYDIKKESVKLLNEYNDFLKIKVCHVVSGLISGGVEAMIYNYISKMNPNSYDFHILYQHKGSEKNLHEFAKIGVKMKEIAPKTTRPFKNFLDTYKYFKKNQFDVIHCHMTLMNFFPLFAGKILKVKIRICHSHNCDVRDKSKFIILLEKILKKFNIFLATDLIACGYDAGLYAFENKKFQILNNALDIEKFKYNEEIRNRIRNQYNIKSDEVLLGHIGRFTCQKNHNFIIEVLKELLNSNNKYKLMLIGDGELSNEIKNSIIKLKLENNIILTGVVSNTNEYYSAFDMFILPSIWEGLPVVASEAQANGLNCFLSDRIDKKVIINREKTMLLPLDENDWIECIKKCQCIRTDNIKTEKILSDEGYNIYVEVKKLENIYNGRKR